MGYPNQTQIGVLNFSSSSSVDSSASIITEFRSNHHIERKEYIPLFDLERLKETISFDLVSVLKIDVEGAELEVLTSFRDVIKNSKPIILIEILPVYEEQNRFRLERQKEIEKILKEAEYSIYRIIIEHSMLINFEEIAEIGIHADTNKCEYVMVPNPKKEIFKKYCSQMLGR